MALYDRHYSRRPSSVGYPNVAGPGRPFVLVTADGLALWVVLAQQAEFTDHAWKGAWVCTVFRNEGPLLSSTLVRMAVARTCGAWGPLPAAGLVTFVDANRVSLTRDPGRCFLKAGFRRVGATASGLEILRRSPCPQPTPVLVQGSNRDLISRPLS